MDKEQEYSLFHEYYGNGAVKEWAHNVPDETHQMFIRMILPVPPEIASKISPFTKSLFEHIWEYHFDSNELYYQNPKCGRDPHTYSWLVDKKGSLDMGMGDIILDDEVKDKSIILNIITNEIEKLVSDDPCSINYKRK